MSEFETFRSEAREFLEANAPKALRGRGMLTMMAQEGVDVGAELRKAHAALSGTARAELDPLLDEHGCLEVLRGD